MVNGVRFLGLSVMVLVSGCSADAVKQVTFNTLQETRQQQCLKNPQSDCPKRETYQDYQRKRDELGQPDQTP